MSDLKIQGIVTIKNGDNVIVDHVPNHFVNHGLLGIMSMTCCKTGSGNLPSNGWKMYIGRDTTTPTTPDMTQLVDPIYDGIGVPPSWQTMFIYDGTSTGEWKITYRAMWGEGTVEGTIGEAALYLTMWNATGFQWTSPTSSLGMASRLAVADTDFEAHTIDIENTLTIDWDINFSFVE